MKEPHSTPQWWAIALVPDLEQHTIVGLVAVGFRPPQDGSPVRPRVRCKVPSILQDIEVVPSRQCTNRPGPKPRWSTATGQQRMLNHVDG